MIRLLPILTTLSLLSGPALGQATVREPTVGYLDITADVDFVEIFLDGRSLGLTPFADTLILLPGWYHVSFFGPEFKWSHWTHRQRKTVTNVIEAGTYQVLVQPGKTTSLEMAWLDLERQLAAYEQGAVFTALIGLGMISSAFFLLSRVN